MGVHQPIAVPKGKDAGLAYLRRLVEEAKASGFVVRHREDGRPRRFRRPPAK